MSLLFVVFGYSDPTTRAGANIANFVLAPYYPDDARGQTAIVEVDSQYVKLRNTGRAWPPTYRDWAAVLRTVDEQTSPAGIVFDIEFVDFREGEGWSEFLAQLCAFGKAACTDPVGETAFCNNPQIAPEAVRVFLPVSLRPEVENGQAHQDLRRMAQDCGHIYRFGVAYGAGFEQVRLYNLSQPVTLPEETGPDRVPSMAAGIYRTICAEPGWFPVQPRYCTLTLRRLDRLDAKGGRMEIFWGVGAPNYDWSARTLRCGLTDYELSESFQRPENLSDRIRLVGLNNCPYPDRVTMFDLVTGFDAKPLEGRLLFVGRDARDGGDRFPVGGAPLVQHSGTFQLQMALDNMLTLGPNIKSDRPAWGPKAWLIIFAFAYAVGAIFLVADHRRKEVRAAPALGWMDAEWRFWLQEIRGFAKLLLVYLFFAVICFFVFNWGFMLWVSSLSLGSIAGVVSALRARS